MKALNLERYPLRLLLPEEKVRRRGKGRGGDSSGALAANRGNTPAAHLQTSIPLRGNTPAAHLQTSISLYRHTCSTPPELLRQNTSMCTGPQHNARGTRSPATRQGVNPKPDLPAERKTNPDLVCLHGMERTEVDRTGLQGKE